MRVAASRLSFRTRRIRHSNSLQPGETDHEAELITARNLQRRAQFYLDFVEAENSTGFHAPQEAARILGESLNYARQGQLAVRDRTFKPTVPVVDIPLPPAAPAATPELKK